MMHSMQEDTFSLPVRITVIQSYSLPCQQLKEKVSMNTHSFKKTVFSGEMTVCCAAHDDAVDLFERETASYITGKQNEYI